MEIVELPRDVHPYFIATQFHPEFKSRPNRAHPLFAGLVAAALKRRQDIDDAAPRVTATPVDALEEAGVQAS